MTINVEKGAIVLNMGLELVDANLQQHLHLQNVRVKGKYV
jgi:hypothetical protein